MSSLLFSLSDVSYAISGAPLFEGLSLQLHTRERICLVGRNGAGKTTLMRMIAGDIEPDAGERFLHPGVRVGYLAQSVSAGAHQTVRDFVTAGLVSTSDEEAQEASWRTDMVIAPLELHPDMRMDALSGGQLRRAALARALISEPDILMLDEPTNHLDIAGIEWLERYLASYNGALICVSHDRAFLAAVSQRVFWLDRGRVRVCPHGYSRFEEWQEKQVAQEARELRNLQQQVAAEHDWTQGGVTARRKRNVRRLRELEQLREKLARDKAAYRQRSQKLEMDPLSTTTASKMVAEFKRVSLSFTRAGETLPILREFSHTILKGDRVGLLGRNGAGKSSFLRLVTGELAPDSGHIFRSKQLDVSYVDQHRRELDPAKTLQDVLCPDGGDHVQTGTDDAPRAIHVCGYLKRFMFQASQAWDKVGTLSGGQQNRLLLARALARPGNLLILDEPTNDLDMETLDMLQETLADYQGTLLLVSHDRDFLDRCVSEILAFEGDGVVHAVIGGYSDYLRQVHPTPEVVRKEKQTPPPAPTLAQSVLVREVAAAKALTYGERLELEQLPGHITALETELDGVRAALDGTGMYERDPQGFAGLLSRHDRLSEQLSAAESRWLELEERGMG